MVNKLSEFEATNVSEENRLTSNKQTDKEINREMNKI